VQLIAAVFGDVKVACRVEVETLAVADAGGEAFVGREDLIRLVGVVAPDARANLELGAGVIAGRVRHAVLHLAGICSRSHRYKQIALRIDGEGVHGWSPLSGMPLRIVSGFAEGAVSPSFKA